MVNPERIRLLKSGNEVNGPVVYWMSRDQRTEDNWALIFAFDQSLKKQVPLYVIFTLSQSFLDSTLRQYMFMIEGLKIVESKLIRKNIPFKVLTGDPVKNVLKFVKENKIGLLISDFSPLKIHRSWKKKVEEKISIPFYEVDAHNIVPCWLATGKLEYGAYTIRPKINKLLPKFLDDYPVIKNHPYNTKDKFKRTDWSKIIKTLRVDKKVKPVNWISSGENEAKNMLDKFLNEKLKNYSKMRNDPNQNVQSELSPYLHFGQISAQRVAMEINRFGRYPESSEAFLEELIVRRELADNYCFHNQSYDSLDAIPNWAKDTLDSHKKDKREFIYNRDEFEMAKTHDPLWNAAQLEMVNRGKMHGYLRMYWAKKILEWSRSPDDAMRIAIYLNDKYELDGRDPNGYAGIAWSIGGVHDRPWFERPIYGKIRSMTFDGCRRKFDVNLYIKRISQEYL